MEKGREGKVQRRKVEGENEGEERGKGQEGRRGEGSGKNCQKERAGKREG